LLLLLVNWIIVAIAIVVATTTIRIWSCWHFSKYISFALRRFKKNSKIIPANCRQRNTFAFVCLFVCVRWRLYI